MGVPDGSDAKTACRRTDAYRWVSRGSMGGCHGSVSAREVMPRGITSRKTSENTAMQGDEDPNLFFPRTEGRLDELSTLGIHKSDPEVVRLMQTLSSLRVFYDAERRTAKRRQVASSRSRGPPSSWRTKASLGKWHAVSLGGGPVRPTRPGSSTFCSGG